MLDSYTGAETMAGVEDKEQLSADMVEDEVMNQLPTLNGIQLEKICDLIELEVSEGLKGKKRDLLRLLMKHLCTGDEEDDKMTQFLQIHEHLKLPDEEDGTQKDEPVVKKDPDVVKEETHAAREEKSTERKDEKKDGGKHLGNSKMDSKPDSKSQPEQPQTRVEVTRMRLKDFKLSGMIGGEGENALSYTSLQFEIAKGKTLGHTETEMCSTVISKVADREMRTYFETTPDLELEDVMDMLKSICTERESSAIFTEFTNDTQKETEEPLTFITRVLRLRRRVKTVGDEEGVSYDKSMLAKRSFQVIFGGLRDENLRFALRERCKEDYTLLDKKILRHASEIITAETERKKKLFGKGKSTPASVNSVDTEEKKDVGISKKEKLNPFVKIEELRGEMKAELNEIKNLVIAHNSRKGDGADEQKKKEEPKPKKNWPRKCPQCVQDNKFRCYHCWECGKDDHKRHECPGNE